MTIPQAMVEVRDSIRLRHFSYAREKAYCHWLQSYMEAVRMLPQEWNSEQKVRRFLTDEAKRGVAAKALLADVEDVGGYATRLIA